MAEYRIRMHPGGNRPDVLWEQIPDNYAILVGRLMAAWSLIEFKLECIIWHFIGGHPRDLRRLTARLDARPKQEAIDELIVSRTLTPEQRKAWSHAKTILTTLNCNRNWLAHGVWLPLPLGGIGVQSTTKGGLRKDKNKQPSSVALAQIKPLKSEDIESWISQAGEAVRHLNALLPDRDDAPSP